MRGLRASLLTLGIILIMFSLTLARHHSGTGVVLGLWSVKYALILIVPALLGLGVIAFGAWGPLHWLDPLHPALRWIQSRAWLAFVLSYGLLEAWFLARRWQRSARMFVTGDFYSVGPLAIERQADSFLLVVALLLIWAFLSVQLVGREPARGRDLAVNVGLGLLSLLASFAVFSVGYATLLRAGAYRQMHDYWGVMSVPDLRYGFRLRPDVRRVDLAFESIGTYRVSTDSDGFRNNGDRSNAPIAVVGDSFVFGLGVDQADLWLTRLEAASGQQVANYGVAGYSPREYRWLVEEYVAPRSHRLLLLAFYANDLLTPEALPVMSPSEWALYRQWFWQWRNPVQYTVHDLLLDSESPTLDLMAQVEVGGTADGTLALSAAGEGMAGDLMVASGNPDVISPVCYAGGYASRFDESVLPALHLYMAEQLALAEQGDYQLVLLLIPSKLSVYREEMLPACGEMGQWLAAEEAGFAALCADAGALGLPCFDATEPLRAAAAEADSLLYFPVDLHWTAEGNRLYGDMVYSFLSDERLLPDAP